MRPDERDDQEVPPEAFGRFADGSSADIIHVDNVDRRPRCQHCRKVLAYYVTRPWRIQCDHCKTVNRAD